MEIPLIKSMDGTVTSGARISVWIDTTEPLFTEKLDKDIETDVVVVGGGIAGMTIAYSAARAGKRVVLIEDGFIGSGETGRTTAHLVTALDDRYYELEKQFGKKKTKLIAESHRRAIDFVEMAVQLDSIDCEFERVPGYLFLHPTDDPESLKKELKAAKNAGLDVEELVDVPGMESQAGPCLRFNNQAQFHPLKYLRGLARAIQEAGGQIYTETHAKDIDHKGIVSADGYKVAATHVVIATNSPVNNKYIPHSRQFAYRTYVIGMRVKKDSVPKALWWDTGDFLTNAQIPPYHYVRTEPLDADYDLLIVGGEDHPTGLPEDDGKEQKNRFGFLESWARERFPVEDMVYQWSGQVMEPHDSLAYIGRNPMDKKNVYIATGDSGNGMTHGTLAGMIISDLICDKENKFEKIYRPSRVKLLKAGGIFAKELVGSLTEYLTTNMDDEAGMSIWNMRPGEGAIVELDKKQYGVYMDTGKLAHVVSTQCMHLGCTIKWNPAEKTWDCPCHGSRYTYKGKVVNGPANKNLLYHKVNISEIKPDKHQ